nr:MAG TPA: hypothetical protein [Caudoviricetes sp.]
MYTLILNLYFLFIQVNLVCPVSICELIIVDGKLILLWLCIIIQRYE